MSSEEVKRELLRLLREDEEFRYAVAGLLGVEDMKVGLTGLREVVSTLAQALARLEETVLKLTDRLIRFEETVAKLAEGLAALRDTVSKLAERLMRLEEEVGRLAVSQSRLESRVESLERGQERLEEVVSRLAESQLRLEARQAALEEAVTKLAEAQSRTELALRELARQVGSLSETVGFGLEDIARVTVPGWLQRHAGIRVEELTRRFFEVEGETVEIDLYGEGYRDGERVVVLGEVRARIYGRDVEQFARLAERVEGVLPRARTFRLMFGYLVHPTAEAEASKRGIALVATYMR